MLICLQWNEDVQIFFKQIDAKMFFDLKLQIKLQAALVIRRLCYHRLQAVTKFLLNAEFVIRFCLLLALSVYLRLKSKQ